jgi:hypothetical protein
MDDARYLDLAANVALSVRRSDVRPISVIVNRAIGVAPGIRALFDQVIVADDKDLLRGAMNKLRLPELTPYERTLYLDADCLLFSPRIEFFWRHYRGLAFAVEGHRQTQGPVFACTIGEKDAGVLCRLLDIAFVGVFNAGVIYFEGDGGGVFAQARALYAGPHRDAISYRYKHEGEYADEPFFGAAMGALGMAPLEPKATQRLQVTTPNMVDAVMDLDLGDLTVLKQTASGKPRPWAGVVCHFCGLAPMDRYFALADKLRREAGLPLMDRGRFNPVVLTSVTHKEQDALS